MVRPSEPKPNPEQPPANELQAVTINSSGSEAAMAEAIKAALGDHDSPSPPQPKPAPPPPRPTAAAAPRRQGDLNYAKWDKFLDEFEEEELRLPPPPPPKELSHEEQQRKQMEDMGKGFDMAAHQRDREANLKHMKAMSPDGKLADAELHNEQLMRDAKQQANQGNLVMGEDGRMVIKDDDELGGSAGRYWWGQNEREVTIKCRGSAGLKSKDVKLSIATRRLKLVVQGETICEGELHASVIADESTFEFEDDAQGRLLVVRLTKATPTKGTNHWMCAIKGEAIIDTSGFGVPITTVNPNDPAAMKAAFD